MTSELGSDAGAGVWWDGVFNPMSPEGLRAALAQEDDEAVFNPSDIRWVAWPGYGGKVHVSQVAELMPIWAAIEVKRFKRYLLLAPLGLAYLAYSWLRTPQGLMRYLSLGVMLLGIIGASHILWQLVQVQQDPKAWGLTQSLRDARRAGIRDK